METLQVGGFVPLTTTDFPGNLAAVVFCQGCPWRCGYCQNPHLISPTASQHLDWQEISAFLRRRIGLLDGVVFSGGEPTLQAALPLALKEVREMGFKTGLHTACPYPERFAEILPLLDWVGFDVKALFAGYPAITGVPGSGEKAREGLLHLLDSGIPYEVRTTVHSGLLSAEDLLELADALREMGVENYVIQEFRPQGCADAALCRSAKPLPSGLVERIAPLFGHFTFRQA